MRNGTCSKCGAKEVHIVDGNRTGVGVSVSWSVNSFANMYVCTKCGYLEFFIEKTEDLPKIAERWPKAE
jgi:predicted nucleic-acid-binding Zn-ribbon protein